MKNQKIEDMSTEALLQRKKTTGFVTGLLAGMLIALLIMNIFLYAKGNSVRFLLLVMPFALSPIVLIMVNDLKAVKKELQTRNQVI